MNGQNRTDRILIAIALVILLLATGMFYFDTWMWGARKARGERIGVITSRTGDVRMKFEDDLKWQKAAEGSDLEYNDAVYSGAGSQAELQIGESKMTVTENSLIVLRRDQNVNFLNLNYGTLFGKLADKEKFVIDTGDGKLITLNASKDARIVLRRQNGKTQLDMTSGQASVTVDGQTSVLNKSSRLVFGDKAAGLVKAHLKIIRPLKDQVIASEEATKVDFNWAWDTGRAATPTERFTLEFSGRPDFKNVHITKQVQGALSTSMTVSQSTSLFYRIKGPGGEVSGTEKINFVRLEKPLIVRPLAQARFEAAVGQSAAVALEFRKPEAATVWYQIAKDPEFKDLVANQNTRETQHSKDLPVGPYFLRARSDFGNGRSTSWTDTRPFSVEAAMQMFKLSQQHLPTRVVIANRAYPRTLYMAPAEMVQSYLATNGLLHDFFPYRASEIDELKVQLDSGDKELYNQKDSAWPQQKLRPGRYAYRYQASKAGFLPSEWSATKKLEIVMEAPRPLGPVTYADPEPNGNRRASWAFTPLLFAKTYDIEVAAQPSFADALEFKTDKAVAATELPQGEFYWRARARDSRGRIISAFSAPYKMDSMPIAPPMLARNDQARKPAQAERTSTRVERVREQAWQRSGWWAWLGTGENYVDYKQSLPGTGALDSHGIKAGSQYFEGGYVGAGGVGAVVSYKNTPGEFRIDDTPVNPSTFRWTTVSLEGMAKQTSRFTLFDSPVVYGIRAGLQQHHMPFLSLAADGQSVNLRYSTMTAGSVGVLAEWMRNRWTYYWTMRYQIPISTHADGAEEFSNTPVFAFDGSIGTAYSITQRLKAGFFWYGQWHQMNFNYNDGTVPNSGSQALFYSNMDLRLGFDF